MNLPNDFFAKRLAAIELEKAHYAAIPLLVDCIEKMQLAGLTEQEIAGIFRQAVEALDKGTPEKA
jgi:hypothetical protein